MALKQEGFKNAGCEDWEITNHKIEEVVQEQEKIRNRFFWLASEGKKASSPVI